MLATTTISASTANLLNFAGWSVICGMLLLIVVPYLRGKTDLFTAWNFALVGCAIFVGVALLEMADPPERIFERQMSLDFPDSYHKATLLRSLVFLACIFGFYYSWPLGKKFASRRFVNSPPWSSVTFGCVLAVCGGVVLASIAFGFSERGFFSQAFMNLGQKAVTFATVFAFYAWYRNRVSAVSLLILLVVVAFSSVYAIRISHGRRLLLCIAFAPVAVAYWTSWRYRRPTRVLLFGAISVLLVITIGLWYQTFRFFSRGSQAPERTFANAMKAAEQVDVDSMLSQLSEWKWRLPEGCLVYSMVVKRLVDTGAVEPRPLETLQFVVAYAIPRRYWDDKPYPLGARIVTDVLRLPYQTNWGLGVAGQAYYEGDWYALVIYSALLVILVRLIDEPLKREPNNPYLIAVCASASLYVVAWPRGDLGVQTVEIAECFLYVVGMQLLGAMLTGAKKGAYALDFGSVFGASQRYISR